MANRERLLFDFGWRFHRGDIPHAPERNYMGTYHNASAKSGRGGAAISFDDSTWEVVDLPHDFVIHRPPEAGENEDHGYLYRDNGYYRNYFRLGQEHKNRRLSLCFDGVATQCIVWVNGIELYRNFTAGIGFEVDFTDVARFGEEVNVVSVYIDNTEFEGWYYEGGGLYRHVWLLSRELLSVEENGVYVRPEHDGCNNWHTHVETTVFNASYENKTARLLSRIYDPDGQLVGYADQIFSIPGCEQFLIRQSIWVVNPQRWTLESPALYELQTVIEFEGQIIDEVKTRFGYRTLEFDPDRGLILNGSVTKIKGMCIHQEHGALGVAIPDGIFEYRIKRLLEMGCNAIRTAHNPPAPELLDICDRLGMMVMDENRWFDSSEEGIHQLNSMLVRDRNHPSIIMWSMFNEEGLMAEERGLRIMNAMRERTHQVDPSRPVTFAQNSGLLKEGVAGTADVIGINYNNSWFPVLHEMYPDRMLFGAETIGYINGRLKEVMDVWNMVLSLPYHGGIFAWTGFDYRGEAHWPDVFFRFGAMDPEGYPKDGFYLYQAYWKKEPVIHIATSWKYEAEQDSDQEIRIYTNGVRAELFADGTSLGIKDVDPAYQTKWEFKYHVCVLEAVAYDKFGREIARTKLDWQRKATSLKLVVEPALREPVANKEDVVIITAYAVDKDGIVCDRTSDQMVRFTVDGPAAILSVGDGDARDYLQWDSYERRIRRGHCQLILRVCDFPGRVTVHAQTDNNIEARLSFDVIEGKPRQYIKSERNLDVVKWFRSPVLEHISDPYDALSADTVGWIPSDTSDCQATHAIYPGGCVGFYADTVIPEFPDGKYRAIQLVFEMMDFPFVARFEPLSDQALSQFEFISEQKGTIRIDMPESYVPGTRLRIRIGASAAHGGQFGINSIVRWNFMD